MKKDRKTNNFTIFPSSVRVGCAIAVVAACVLLFTPAVQAMPLNLTLFDSPDIMAGFINVSYNAGTGTFQAIGWPLEMDDGNAGSIP